MNSIKRFKNLLSILMLYASNLIVHDKVILNRDQSLTNVNRRIAARVFPKLTTNEKI